MIKQCLLVGLLVAGAAHADGLKAEYLQNLPKADPAVLARIAASTEQFPSEVQDNRLFDFSTMEVSWPGALGELRYGEVKTRFREVMLNADPYRDSYNCIYPKGGVMVLYVAANPQNNQMVAVNYDADKTCQSTAWRIVKKDGDYSVSRRFDTRAAWSAHWREANAWVKSSWASLINFIGDQPIFDAIVVLIIGALVWRWRRNKK